MNNEQSSFFKSDRQIEYRNTETKNDRWIVEHIFPDIYGKYFVEAGAGNGIDASSCYVLEKYFQWTGICIEPNDDYYQQLVINRPNSIWENLCLSDTEGIVTYLQGDEATVHPMLGGIKSNLLQYKKNSQEIIYKGQEIKKPSTTLVKLLQKHNAPKVIHYLAMDIEGSELPVLRKFPFQEYQILAISIEGHQCNDLLTAQGYLNIKNPFNIENIYEQYFIHKSIADLKTLEINAQHYVSIGNNFKRQHKLTDAIASYQKALSIEPNNLHIYAYLATTQKKHGDLPGSISSFQRIIEINPQYSPWIYSSIGDAFQQSGQYNKAIKAYYQAIELNADSPAWVYQCLGDILRQQQRWNEAIKAYQQATTLQPDNPALQRKLKLAQIMSNEQ
ncbi:MAG: FkbM family methyltransferase [Cyanobacteria bacterium J06621_8]